MTAKIQLYPHNQRAYESVLELWKQGNKAAVIQATGTGKSFIILQCLLDLQGKSAVVLEPRSMFMEQIPLTASDLPSTRVLTYAKLSQMSMDEIESLNPSLIVLDEFHRCGAETWGAGVERLLEAFPQAKLLGASATPIRYLDGERDMSDELFEGSVAVNLTVTDAIAQGVLPMPKYVAALYTFSEEAEALKTKIDNSANDEESKAALHKELEQARRRLERSHGVPQILQKHASTPGKYIVFCRNKAHLAEMEVQVIDWFKRAKIGKEIKTYFVAHGASGNKEVLEAFVTNDNSENVRLLFSIEMLNEALHVPDVSGVILLRPTVSPIIYYQQIGRALQAGRGDTPLILDLVNNKESVRVGDFQTDLEESFKRGSLLATTAGEPKVSIPEFFIVDESAEAFEVFKDIEVTLVDDWDLNFVALKAYLEEFKEYPNSKTRLGKWVTKQRVNRIRSRSGFMNEYKISKLNSIGFVWKYYDKRFDEGLENLKCYMRENGNCNVPHHFEMNGFKLGFWVSSRRSSYKKGELHQSRVEELEELGFVWDALDQSFNEGLQYLNLYKNEKGNCRVPKRFEIKGFKLGSWVQEQRSNYKKGKLQQHRIIELENIGFVWEIGQGQNQRKREGR